MKCFALAFLFHAALAIAAAKATAAPPSQPNPVLDSWLGAQTNVQSWSADFVQTRTLKSLTQPLTATGHVWFAAPNRFRWELRSPGQTIALREAQSLVVIYPQLKRAERYSLAGADAGGWRDALALLEAGFPRSKTDLERQYTILSEKVQDSLCELALRPKSAAARRMMPQIRITFDTQSLRLSRTDLQFADGSTLSNEFKNDLLNPKVDPALFSADIPADYKVTEPLKP